MELRFDVEETGIYYVVVSSCDYRTYNAKVVGTVSAENPYGHLPASLCGSYPFYCLLLLCYSICIVFWIIQLQKYSTEVVNIHYVILGVLICVEVDSILRVVYLHFYNSTGISNSVLTTTTTLVNILSRILLRVLLMMVCLG